MRNSALLTMITRDISQKTTDIFQKIRDISQKTKDIFQEIRDIFSRT